MSESPAPRRVIETIRPKVPAWIGWSRQWLGATLLLLVVGTLACLVNLGGTGLVSMEGMLTEGGQNMLVDGQWAVPVLYGEIYTYKPAFAYWLSAGAQTLERSIGQSPMARSLGLSPEFWLRLPFGLAGLVLGFGIFVVVGRILGPGAGFFAASATMLNSLFAEKIRLAEFDGPLAATVGIAILFASVSLVIERQRLLGWLACYVALTLGILAKGTPAVMVFAPGLLLSALVLGELRRLFSWRHLFPFFLMVAAIFFYGFWAVETSGTEVFAQPVSEAGARGVSWSLDALATTLTKPLLIFAVFLPWSLLLSAAIRNRVGTPSDGHRQLFDTTSSDGRRRRGLVLAALCFLVAAIATFMLVPTHKMRYYLPLATPLGLAAGIALDSLLLREPKRLLIRTTQALLLVLTVTVFALALSNRPPGWPIGVVGAILFASAAFAKTHTGGQKLSQLCLAIGLVIVVGQSYVVIPQRAAKRDLSDLAREMAKSIPEDVIVFIEGPSDTAGKHASFLHYLERTIATYPALSAPPAGSIVLLTHRGEGPAPEREVGEPRVLPGLGDEVPERALPPRTPVAELAAAQGRRYHYRLVRVLPEPGGGFRRPTDQP